MIVIVSQDAYEKKKNSDLISIHLYPKRMHLVLLKTEESTIGTIKHDSLSSYLTFTMQTLVSDSILHLDVVCLLLSYRNNKICYIQDIFSSELTSLGESIRDPPQSLHTGSLTNFRC